MYCKITGCVNGMSVSRLLTPKNKVVPEYAYGLSLRKTVLYAPENGIVEQCCYAKRYVCREKRYYPT